MDQVHLYLSKLGDVKQSVGWFSTQQHLGHLFNLYTTHHLCSPPVISKQPTPITRARRGPAFSL